MVKYEIEGGINFYDELYKSMDIMVDLNKDDVCLITGENLTEHFVKLDCGHAFNYIPLYNDVLNHKKKYNNMERSQVRCNEIRCPYCRTIHKNVLPYYEDLELDKVHGVNFYDHKNAINLTSNNIK